MELFSNNFKEIRDAYLTFHIGNDVSWSNYFKKNENNILIYNNTYKSQKIINKLEQEGLYKPPYKNILWIIHKELEYFYKKK